MVEHPPRFSTVDEGQLVPEEQHQRLDYEAEEEEVEDVEEPADVSAQENEVVVNDAKAKHRHEVEEEQH